MKSVFIGGGAHRHLPILRSALAIPGIFDGGEINLYDLNVSRAEVMGRMLMRTPEYARAGCKVTWGTTLEQALEGADLVSVVLMAGSRLAFELGSIPSVQYGFLSSDNVSPNGAFLALKGGPILMNIARKMEQYCPNALLLDFANPVAVHSAAVNNHTRIRALGICAGYTNHLWDINRVLGQDTPCTNLEVDVAGINHMSFILGGTLDGKPLFDTLRQRLSDPQWGIPSLHPSWSPSSQRNIRHSVSKLVEFFRDLGVLIFSTEGDGMAHLQYDDSVAQQQQRHQGLTAENIIGKHSQGMDGRAQLDQEFAVYLDQDLSASFWEQPRGALDTFARVDNDITVRVLLGLAGVARTKIVTSQINRGTVAGIKDRTVLEYSQYIDHGMLTPAGHYEIPDIVHGVTNALATHQTMLGDAIATEDPDVLYHALLAYPMKQNSQDMRALYKALLEINKDEIPAVYQRLHERF